MINSLPLDLLIRIKNAYLAGREATYVPLSQTNRRLLLLLKKHQLISDFTTDSNHPRQFLVELLYRDLQPALTQVSIYSKPGRRIYQKVASLPWGKTQNSLIIVSTSSGLLSQRQAKKAHLGGEIIAELY